METVFNFLETLMCSTVWRFSCVQHAHVCESELNQLDVDFITHRVLIDLYNYHLIAPYTQCTEDVHRVLYFTHTFWFFWFFCVCAVVVALVSFLYYRFLLCKNPSINCTQASQIRDTAKLHL